jgi:hypothetical protein
MAEVRFRSGRVVGEAAAVCVSSEHALCLLELGDQVEALGSWERLPETEDQRWSENLFGLSGLEPGSIIQPWTYTLERSHSGDRERVARFVESTRCLANPAPVGVLFWLRTIQLRSSYA